MHRTLALLTAFVFLALATRAAAVEGKGKVITFQSGDDKIKGYLVEPKGKGPFPAIVVIQEWWGLTDWIKDNARRLAKQGYVTLAPDLYRGKVAKTPMVARQLMGGLPKDRPLRDLKAAVDVLAKHDKVDKSRIGSIGWCMGGGFSLQLALHDPRIKASAICYGRVVTDADKLKPLKAAVLGIFGEQDKGIPPSDVEKFEKALKEAGKKIDRIKEFKAGHGFMRPSSDDGENPAYREEEAKKAWKDIDRFFAKHLKGEVER
jgi:carboxymethylenebutenolidase